MRVYIRLKRESREISREQHVVPRATKRPVQWRGWQVTMVDDHAMGKTLGRKCRSRSQLVPPRSSDYKPISIIVPFQ